MAQKFYERNQIRVLCNNCGCYYYWDTAFDFKNYSRAVNTTPKKANLCCPECGSQEMANHAHHSAGFFNCEIAFTDKLPHFFSGPGSAAEPKKAKKIAHKDMLDHEWDEKISFHPTKISSFSEAKVHKIRHKELHGYLNELVVDMQTHRGIRVDKITVLDLINWSREQTIKPTEK